MPYEIYVRAWWKENKDWPEGLEPNGAAVKSSICPRVWSEDIARNICTRYNATHDPGRLGHKAEYIRTY